MVCGLCPLTIIAVECGHRKPATRGAPGSAVRQFLMTWRSIVKKWQCVVCGFIYDEAEGWPDDGIEPGTAWEDVPEDWMCPDCGVGKEDFEMIEIG